MIPTPWAGLLALVDRASAFGPDVYGSALHTAAGGARSAVCVLAGRGDVGDDVNLGELEGPWIHRQHDFGNRVGVWWQLTGDATPLMQARACADVVRGLEEDHGLIAGDLFVMIEDENQGNPTLAPAFIAGFRERLPLRQAAVVPLGLGFKGGDGNWYPADVNLAAWRAAGFRDYPEAYEGAMRPVDVDGCLRAHRHYFAATLIRPMLSALSLEAVGAGESIAGMARARAAGAFWKGCGVFPGERLTPAGWLNLGAALRARQLIA